MKASVQSLCNNILSRAHKEKINVTPMKLQKLLYYVCVKYVKETGISPIHEKFEVWKYGPVVPSVYFEFKPFGSLPIKGFSYNAKKKSMMIDENANPMLKLCINYVWEKFKTYDGVDLAKRTHQEGSGWRTAYLSGKEIISTEEMKNDETL